MHCRRRLISFRLSDEEYDRLKRLSAEHGAQSLSDFVRSRMCAMTEAGEPWEQELDCTMKEFGKQTNGLLTVVEQMGHLLRTAQHGGRREG
jgi:hypothetical protein